MFDHITKDFLGNKKSIAIGFCFLTPGLLFGTWATFVPFIKSAFNLNDATLGLLLLSMPFGALLLNPVAATLVRLKGMIFTTLLGFYLLLFFFSLIFFQSSIYILPVVLFGCGSSIAIINVSMNAVVGVLEEKEKIKIMSTCHGLFSLGLMMGSLLASYSGGLGTLPKWHLLALVLILFISMFIFIKEINDVPVPKAEKKGERTKFFIPKGAFLLMIIISLCTNITEGTMADWTAVYMREVVSASPYYLGIGLTGYSLFMALGRFLGDYLIPKFGPNNILFYGGLLCIIGLLVAIVFPFTATAILGFSLVGAGVSCGAPILYAGAAKTPGMPPGAGLAIMNTFAMGGFLFGPVLIGFISDLSTLKISFSFVASLCLIWVYFARKIELA